MTRATSRRFSQVFSTRPSGILSEFLQETRRILAASAASRARSSAVPRVPISPLVRSRMPVRCPRCAIFSSVPPQVCSTSSRWAAMARISSGAVDMLVDSLLENYDAQMISGQGVVGCVPLLAYPIGEMRLQLEFRSLLRRLRVGDCHRFPPAHLPADLPPDLPPDSSGSSSGSGKSSFSQTFSPSDVVLEVPFYRTRSGRSDDLCAD